MGPAWPASGRRWSVTAIGEREPRQRGWGSAAAVTISVLEGAHIVRVHDVAAMADVTKVADMAAGLTPDKE